jgi:uncharacterized damage-inducible protein DinB
MADETMADGRKILHLPPMEGYPGEIGGWMAALEEARRRTLRAIAGLDPRVVDRSDGAGNSIGTLLYHIALIEMDWLFAEIVEEPFPAEVVELFPFDVRDAEGRLTPVTGVDLADHRERLRRTRGIFLEAMRRISPGDYHRPRILPSYSVTPAWVLHHLMQHEAEHRGQIIDIAGRAARAPSL